MTPFQAVYDRELLLLIRMSSLTLPIDVVDKLLQEWGVMLDLLKSHLIRAQAHMKSQADKHQHDTKFAIGNMVYLKLKPHMMKSLASRTNEKLAHDILDCLRCCTA